MRLATFSVFMIYSVFSEVESVPGSVSFNGNDENTVDIGRNISLGKFACGTFIY